MRKKQRLNSTRLSDDVQASLADFDLTGTKENSLISEKQSDSSGSTSASIVNKHNGDIRAHQDVVGLLNEGLLSEKQNDPSARVDMVETHDNIDEGAIISDGNFKKREQDKQKLITSVITDKAHVPPAELNRSDEKNALIYGKEIDSHSIPSSNSAKEGNAETYHSEDKLSSDGRNRRRSFDFSQNMQPTKVAGRVTSNSDEFHSTKTANNEVEGVINVSTVQPQIGAHFKYTDKKLLILDVNGLLADIVAQTDCKYKHDIIVSRKYVFKRPFCDSFLQFCFEKFHVGVWSSRVKANLDSIINFLMPDYRLKLLFCWDQSHCTNTGFKTTSNYRKPLFLKELKKVWDKLEPGLPWNKGDFNETNTLLIDDSPYKALSNPANTAIFPHSYDHKNAGDCSLGPVGDLRAYLEKLAESRNVQEYVALNPFGQKAITELNDFHQKVLRSVKITSDTEPPPPPPLPLPPQYPTFNSGTASLGGFSQFQQSGLFPRSGFWNQMLRPCSTGDSRVCDFQHQSYPPAPESHQSIAQLNDQYDPFIDSIEPSSSSSQIHSHFQQQLPHDVPGELSASSRYPTDLHDSHQALHLPEFGVTRSSTHFNPYASTFHKPLSSRFISNTFMPDKGPTDNPFSSSNILVDQPGARSRHGMSSPFSRAREDKYDPPFDSIEPPSDSFKKFDHVL